MKPIIDSFKIQIIIQKLILSLIVLVYTANAGSFCTGIGIGMTYALFSPKIGYEFDNGFGTDFSASYFNPGIDYNLGFYYNFKFLNNEVYLGPRITLGQREYEASNGTGFEASFLGITGNFRTYFYQKHYIDYQAGFEFFKSKYFSDGNSIGLEPSAGMSYGFEFNKLTLGNKTKVNRTSFSKGAILTGQIIGGLLIISGIAITGAVIPELSHPDPYGFTYSFFAIGLSSICIGSFDVILLNKFRYRYE